MSSVKRDAYCWVCHLDLPLIKCKNCPRNYHRKCAHGGMLNYPDPDFHEHCSNPHVMDNCPECIVSTNTALPSMKFVSKREVKRILTFVTKNLKDGYYWPNPFYKIDISERYTDLVAKVVDISTLEVKVSNNEFQTLEGFLAEAKWMLHNTIICHGRTSKESKVAEEMMRLCRIELMAADLCPECYCKEQNREWDSKWFIRPCLLQPHVLGWVKLPNLPYWPAKIMQDRGNEFTVRCFGDYRRYDISKDNCYFFSSNNPPVRLAAGKRREELEAALSEIECHIDEARDVYGYMPLPCDGDGNPLPADSMPLSDAVTRMFSDWVPGGTTAVAQVADQNS